MRPWSFAPLALLALSATAAEPMRLCIAGQACRDYTCGQRIEAVAVAHTYDLSIGTAHHLGIAGANETTIACSSEAFVDLRVTAAGIARDGEVHVSVADEAKHVWELRLPAKDLQSRVGLPTGRYALTIESAHYRTVRKSVRAAAKPEKVAVVLEPLPLLSGRVLERGTGAVIPGAVVTTNGETSAVADGTGSFSIESDPDRWPATFTVSAGGYADTTMPVPRARTSARLGDVFLNRGGSITIHVIAPDDVHVRQIELQKLRSGATLGTSFRKTTINGEQPVKARFDRIEPGRYVVLVKGSGPFEQRGESVELREGDERTVEVRVSPIRLHIGAMMKGAPLAGARINLDLREGHWSGQLESGSTGEVTVALWQPGPAMAWVYSEGVMNIPHFENRTIEDQEEVEWILNVDGRRINGVVVDSKTGAPVPDAVISLRTTGEVGFGVRTRSDSDGRFKFVPVPYGRHTLTAASATHLQASLTYVFSPPDESRDVTIRLDGGSIVHLRVVDAAGAAVVRGLALQYNGLLQTRLGGTDDSGIAEILVPDGETRDVYVIARDGSFAIVRVSSKPAEMTLRLPPATSRIELRAESDTHEPIPNVSVVMRYNGQLVPTDVVESFGRVQGAWTRSHADGRLLFDHMPAGLYEFWPAGSPAEMRLLAAGAGPQAPATINVTAGDNVAVLTFTRVP